jgi:hypothetical protein
MDITPTSLQQWNISAQRQYGDWMLSTTYLGNKSTHLWRATELNPAVFAAGATTANTNQRRRLILQDPVQGQFYGTIGQVDDTGRGIYHGLLLSAQRRLKNNLSVLTNYTLSKCMSDPATTEITGPTIVDPNNPDRAATCAPGWVLGRASIPRAPGVAIRSNAGGSPLLSLWPASAQIDARPGRHKLN